MKISLFPFQSPNTFSIFGMLRLGLFDGDGDLAVYTTLFVIREISSLKKLFVQYN